VWFWPSMSTCALRSAPQAQQHKIPFHASFKMRVLELKFEKVENFQWSWSWWCSKNIASMRLCFLRLLLWCRSSYTQLCLFVVKLVYMNMLATIAPIWKLFKLFPQKAQPPHIFHAIAHKLLNLSPSHDGHLLAVEDICEPLSKRFHVGIGTHCLVA
jgi:hypothetical protein